jgi:hypothetical protein
LLNSYSALILPGLISSFNLVIVRQFFMNLPQELIDSARIDGASEWQVFWNIALPLSKAVLAVVALFYAVAIWNSFFNAILYLQDATKWPIQLVLRQYVLQGTDIAAAADSADTPDGDRGRGHGADPDRLPIPAEVLHKGCIDRCNQGVGGYQQFPLCGCSQECAAGFPYIARQGGCRPDNPHPSFSTVRRRE